MARRSHCPALKREGKYRFSAIKLTLRVISNSMDRGEYIRDYKDLKTVVP